MKENEAKNVVIRFQIENNIAKRFKQRLRERGYSHMSEYLRSSIRKFLDD